MFYHSIPVEAESFIQKLASHCARLPKEARYNGNASLQRYILKKQRCCYDNCVGFAIIETGYLK